MTLLLKFNDRLESVRRYNGVETGIANGVLPLWDNFQARIFGDHEYFDWEE